MTHPERPDIDVEVYEKFIDSARKDVAYTFLCAECESTVGPCGDNDVDDVIEKLVIEGWVLGDLNDEGVLESFITCPDCHREAE